MARLNSMPVLIFILFSTLYKIWLSVYRATESVPSKNQKVKSERLCSVTYLASHKGTGKLYHTLRQTSACQIQPGSLQDTLTHIYISKKERKNWRKIRSIDPSLFSTDDFKDKISHTHIKSLPQDWLCSRRYNERKNPQQAVLQPTQCANLRERKSSKWSQVQLH